MVDHVVAVAKALSDANRIKLLLTLEQGEAAFTDLSKSIPISPSSVSKHLSQLTQARLVDSRRLGRSVLYRLATDKPSPAIERVLSWVFEECRSFSNDGVLLRANAKEEMKTNPHDV